MAQISLSLVMLFSGGLFFHSALNASGLDLGFAPAGSVVTEFDFSLTRTPEATVRQNLASILVRVQQLPGVRSAALATQLPYTNIDNMRRVVPAGVVTATGSAAQPPAAPTAPPRSTLNDPFEMPPVFRAPRRR